jgi:hypothetical protein
MAARGGLLKLLDAYIAIGGDMSGFDAAIAQSEGKAKAAGDRIESAFSPRRVLGALATVSAAAFGVMTKGGLDLNETLTNVQARSGATGAQWDAMSNAIQRQNRRTTLSLTEIGDGVAAITTDLQASAGEVGMAADRLTDFGLVAQESFASAVKGADDLHDAYQLTLAETLSVLDTLEAGQQKFGGTLTANREALISVAPALTAANMTWQQGAELINLFNSAGVDASTMTMALQHALRKVKSPEEFARLVADIQATEDPFARATKAADLFGALAGAKMANALAPGRGAIENYGFTTQETADKVEIAARKIDSSWRRTLDLLVQNVTGFLAQVGNAAGPVIGIVGSLGSALAGLALTFPGLGPKLIGAITGPLVGAAGVQAWMTTGTKIGTLIGAAIGPALALAAAGAVVLTWATINDQLNQQAAAIETQTAAFVQTATLDQLEASRAAIGKGMADILNLPFGRTLYGDQLASMQRDFDAVTAQIEAKRQAASNAFRAGERGDVDAAARDLAASRTTLEAAAATGFGGIPAGIRGLTAETRKAVADLLTGAANEIRSRRSGIDAAIDQLNADLKNKPLTQTTELERLLKARTSKSLTDALKSPDAQIRADAKALATSLDSAIADLKPRPGIMSKVSEGLIDDLKTSTDTELRGFAGWFALQVQSQAAIAAALAAMPPAVDTGTIVGGTVLPDAAHRAAIASGIKSAGSEVVVSAALQELMKAALDSADPLIRADARAEGTRWTDALAEEISSATAKAKIAAAMALLAHGLGGLTLWTAKPGGASVDTGTMVGGTLVFPSGASGIPYVPHDQLTYIHQREAVLTVDQADAWRSAGTGGAGAREQHINIEHIELADAHDEFTVIQHLRFLASLG